MSHEIKRLEKYLESRGPKFVEGEEQVIIVSDSKGKYMYFERFKLNELVGRQVSRKILWHYRGGREGHEGVQFIEGQLEYWSNKYTSAIIVFWHGTCDITRKDEDFLFLRYPDVSGLSHRINTYLAALRNSVGQYANLKLFILEAPPISIKAWNRLNDYPNWEAIDNNAVLEAVEHHNEIVRQFNSESGFVSPKFTLDLYKTRKGAKDTHARYSINFQLIEDGIHPLPIVALYWLLRILEQCYQKP